MIRNVKIWVTGRVQGVGFRQSTKNKAKKWEIVGTVRNLEDGRVEIIAQAEVAQMQAFIDWCRKGPLMARVDHVEIIDLEEIEAPFLSFQIV